ncbi:MAG: terminase family protein [Armatimonadota bacterium]|nr:terminase family protein [Armatimonadota bacterium]
MTTESREAKTRLRLARQLFGWRPHKTQRLWLLDDSKVKVAACGRRWGKTEAQAVDAALYAVCNPGSKQMIVSPTYDQSKLIFNTVDRLLSSCPATRPAVKVKRSPYPRLNLRKSLITARTADEDGRNLRGHNADRVIVDEAAYVRDAVIEEVIAPMLADRDGQLIMISTPFGRNHFYRAFLKGESSEDSLRRYASFRFPSWENPHISREYIDGQREALTPRQFSVEYEAQFLDDQNSVFRWADIEAAVAAYPAKIGTDPSAAGGLSHFSRSETESASAGWRTAGVDWARYSDYTAVVVLDAGVSLRTVVAIDRFNQMNWQDQVTRVADFLQKHRVNSVTLDQVSIGDALLEMLQTEVWDRRGMSIDVHGVKFTNTSKREVIDNLVARLAHRDLAIPDDQQLIKELQFYEYEVTEAGNLRLNAKTGYRDDMVIALALAAWTARSAPSSDDDYRILSSAGRLSYQWGLP